MKHSRLFHLERLWPYLKPQLPALLFASLLSIPIAALTFSPAPAVKYLSDRVLVDRDPAALRFLVVAIPLAFALNFVLRFFNQYLIRASANRAIQQLRNDLYRRLLSLSLGFFNEAQGGVLLSRVINDVQAITRAISSVVDLVREPLSALALLAYAFYLNWRLTVVTLLLIPVCAFLLANAGKHAKRYSGRILGKLGEMSSLLTESVAGMRVIQAFHLEHPLRRQFQKANQEFTRASLQAIRVEELSRPGIEMVFGLALAGLMFLVGHEKLKGHMSTGDVVAFFSCFGMLLQPIRKLSELNVTFHQSAAAIESVCQILEAEQSVKSPPNALPSPPLAEGVEFRSVTFRYPGAAQPVLRDFSFRLRKGEVVALVGPSGAGKSTVLGLIPRFFDPQEGAVLMDGHELRQLELTSLRSQVALVTQEVFLFHDTVRANIKAGRHDLSESEVRSAAEAAQAWSFIERLPRGLDTVIGDRGQKLSGGERQRLSIARAILKNAPILLLDEATSALDSENERLVQAALEQLLQGRTALVVAHRLSTIRRADRILVLEQGSVVEEGTHASLAAKGGAYARALALQQSLS